MTNEQRKRLFKLAYDLAMAGKGELAQDIRDCLNDARRYLALRDFSQPETWMYYMACDSEKADYKNVGAIDRQIDQDEGRHLDREREFMLKISR